MILKLLVKDYDGFSHALYETFQAVEDVAERIFKILSDVSFVESVSVSQVLTTYPSENLKFWGWFTYGDSYEFIYSNLKAL